VVAGVELELHELARLGRQPLGGVGKAAVLGDGDDPGPLGRSQARESGEGECCELHLEGGDVWVVGKSDGSARRRSD
jgi:hypothetical protein